MDRIAKALAAHDEVYAQINDVLFGGGADELVSKLSAAEKKAKSERTQAQVGLATNVIGIGAGAAATPPAFKAVKEKRDAMKGKKPPAPGKGLAKAPKGFKAATASARRGAAKPKVALALAGGAAGLQVANLGGDFVANRVLSRSAKKPVKKNSPDQADLHVAGGRTAKAKFVARKLDQKTPAIKAKGKKLELKAKDAILKSEELDVVWGGEISKIDEDQRLVFGYASVVEVNGEPVVDRQGDYISIDEIEKSAYTYVEKSRKGGDMHRRNGEDPHHVSDMVESFVITKEKIEKMGLPEDTPLGWWVGFRVNDDDTWSEVKKGNRKGFSVHGKGNRVSKVIA